MRQLISLFFDIIHSIIIGIFVMVIPAMCLMTLILGGIYTLWILGIVGILSLFYAIGEGMR